MNLFKAIYSFTSIGMLGVAWSASGKSLESKMIQAYGDGQYYQAIRLAQKCKNTDKRKLIVALCRVYDLKRRDISEGLPALQALYENKSIAVDIRLVAGLSCARAAQTLSMRDDIYSDAKLIDYRSIYDAIIRNHPDTSAAVFSLMYLGQELFEDGKADDTKKAFTLFRDFIRSYRGDERYITPLHLMLADQYIIHGRHYDKAVKHLEQAYRIGISNPKNSENTSYRIARIYATWLNNRNMAVKWYKQYLKQYPNSSNSAMVKRYLKEMNANSTEVKNG